jgi:hypothetical protein
MLSRLKGWVAAVAVAGLSLAMTGEARAAGFGVKGGVGLLQKEDLYWGGTTSGKTLWMVGGYLDVGGVASSRVRITPSFEYSTRTGTKIISGSIEGRFQFYRGPKAVVYAGMGPGVNVKEAVVQVVGPGGGAVSQTQRKTQGSLNVPIGVEWKLGKGGWRWTFEMKMAIADSQVDSAYRIGTGFAFAVK